MPEFFEALSNVAPYVAVVLIFGFFLAQMFGFQPIRILQRHGVVVAVAVIVAFTLVAVVALLVRQPEPPYSSLDGGAELRQFFNLNAETSDRSVSVVAGNEEANTFTTTTRHEAPDDRRLAFEICNRYTELRCEEADQDTIYIFFDG